MSIIWCNVPPSTGGGGPSVWSYKMTQELQRLGHRVIFDKPQRSDVALCVINTGKILGQVNRQKTKVLLRIDGIYNAIYNQKFNRTFNKDMQNFHNELKRDIPKLDHVIYQSQWSKDRIDDEIVERKGAYSIIHNGVDVKLFKPSLRPVDGSINLFHIGKMRNGYIMESLVGTLQELRRRGHNVKMIMAGNMDAECSAIYAKHKSDPHLVHLGAFPNTAAAKAFGQGDVYLGPRMGSSCDNVIVEALACGLPVVIPKWGGNAELIEDGIQGVVVDSGGKWNYGPDYILKLADGVEKILSDLNAFKLRARKHAVQNHTIEKMAAKYLAALGI